MLQIDHAMAYIDFARWCTLAKSMVSWPSSALGLEKWLILMKHSHTSQTTLYIPQWIMCFHVLEFCVITCPLISSMHFLGECLFWFLKSNLFIWVCVCVFMSVWTHTLVSALKSHNMGIGSVASGGAVICELPAMCTTTYNTFLMIEHWAHLTAEWFLYPPYLDLDFPQSDQITFYRSCYILYAFKNIKYLLI